MSIASNQAKLVRCHFGLDEAWIETQARANNFGIYPEKRQLATCSSFFAIYARNIQALGVDVNEGIQHLKDKEITINFLQTEYKDGDGNPMLTNSMLPC